MHPCYGCSCICIHTHAHLLWMFMHTHAHMHKSLSVLPIHPQRIHAETSHECVWMKAHVFAYIGDFSGCARITYFISLGTYYRYTHNKTYRRVSAINHSSGRNAEAGRRPAAAGAAAPTTATTASRGQSHLEHIHVRTSKYVRLTFHST